MRSITKLVVGSTFGIHPPRGGGSLRISHLYRQLARQCPVDVVALVDGREPPVRRELAPGLTETRVPRSDAHSVAESRLHAQVGTPITDVAFPELHSLTPAYGQALAESVCSGCVLVASHPYALPALRAADPGAELWYDAHNVELDLKAAILPSGRAGRRLLDAVRDVERECCRRASLVIATSAEDLTRLGEVYGPPAQPRVLVPNGVDTDEIAFTAPSRRRELRRRLRLPRPVALFIGSWHEPNVVAARHVIAQAYRLREVTFAIAGSVGIPLAGEARPDNVELYGTISDELKAALLGVAEVALNPMEHGGGTNMKMLDYLAAGIPVVSTGIGARGLSLEPGRDVCIAALDGFPEAIRDVLRLDGDMADERADAARRVVVEQFDWRAVSAPLVARLGSGAAQPAPARSATSA